MTEALLLIGCVIALCTLMGRFLDRLAVPSLLIFIALGMCFGENGLLRIYFNDYYAVNLICSVSLIFIMFYGGFGTNLSAARPVAVQSVVLSTLGVAGTAALVAAFAHWALKLPWLESFLIGSVISSTDAASVFNILRSKKLALKEHTDSLLEIESGSNDPISYMLTTVAVGLMSGEKMVVPLLLLQQLAVGILCGCCWASWPSGPCGGEPSHRNRARPSSSFLWSSCPMPCLPPWGERVSQRLSLRYLDGKYQAAPEALFGPLL